jgi:hypothetical protein
MAVVAKDLECTASDVQEEILRRSLSSMIKGNFSVESDFLELLGGLKKKAVDVSVYERVYTSLKRQFKNYRILSESAGG